MRHARANLGQLGGETAKILPNFFTCSVTQVVVKKDLSSAQTSKDTKPFVQKR